MKKLNIRNILFEMKRMLNMFETCFCLHFCDDKYFFLILLYVNLTLVLYACVLWAIWACKCIFMRNIWDLLNYRVFSKHKHLLCHRLIICFNPTLGYNCGVFSKIWQQHKFKKWFHSSMWLPNMNFGIGIYVFTN
jgi:hypothetical protein